MTTPVLSIVMPVFNREKIVGEAIASVLAQTYAHFELIVVDDGSKDDSVAAVKAFDDPRIRLIELPYNRGVSAARVAHACHPIAADFRAAASPKVACPEPPCPLDSAVVSYMSHATFASIGSIIA